MTTTTLNVIQNKSLMELDGPIGLPSGVKPAPIEYNLGKINKYLKKTGKGFKELTDSELKQFKI
ncbi:TPA: hypothetical protein U0616_001788 [Streptococcus suis]|nr:hypothetical protein [Streptococcus suis]HEM6308627.1 hypothetical protein [Streptococcus suis]